LPTRRSAARRDTLVRWAALCTFTGAATWSLATAIDMRRAYQDSWLLEGLWPSVALALAAYVVASVSLRRPRHVALLATALAVLLNAVPALKYAYPYASTSDTADHVLLIRSLAMTGQADPGAAYQHTPGLHLLVAALSSWSGTLLWLWTRLFPPLLGALLPLGFYLLCARLPLPAGLARPVLALSPFALPLLYALNGTSFTAPLLVALLALLLVRESNVSWGAGSGDAGRGPCMWEVGHTVLVLVLSGAIIFWHPISSLLYPMVLLAAGAIGQLRPACRRVFSGSSGMVSVGASMVAGVLVFWFCRADYVWARLIKNLRLMIEPRSTPALVPARLGELDLVGQARMALLFHGRDAAMLALAGCGVFFLAWSVVRRGSGHRVSSPRQKESRMANGRASTEARPYGVEGSGGWAVKERAGTRIASGTQSGPIRVGRRVRARPHGVEGREKLRARRWASVWTGARVYGREESATAGVLRGATGARTYGSARRALHTYGLVWLLFFAVVCGVFAYQFGAQGYQRFLVYLVTLSPLPAGYALWRAAAALHRPSVHGRRYSGRPLVAAALCAVAILSCFQLYPYQPAVPAIEAGAGVATPSVWLHLVNSEHQRLLLLYAAEKLPPEAQLVVDYAGHRQARLFSGTMLQDRLRRTEQARPVPAYLLLHWPGAAGPYMEQAEFRSTAALQAWRDRPGMSTIYDNGGAFILYYSGNAADPFRLEPSGE
jgi:hypothetical protein